MLNKIIKAIELVPEVKAHLSPETRAMIACYKSQEDYTENIKRLVTRLYNGEIEQQQFNDEMKAVIVLYLTKSFMQSWNEYASGDLNAQARAELEQAIARQVSYIDGYASDIIAARDAGKPIEPLLARAEL